MRLSSTLFFALSDLAARRMPTLFTGLGLYLGASTLLVFGLVGSALFGFLGSSLDETSTRRVEFEVPSATAVELRLTDAKLAALRAAPEVDTASPVLEMNVEAAAGARHHPVPATSTHPTDPLFVPKRMRWGRGVVRGEEFVAVVGHALFRRLGGRLEAEGPTPRRMEIEVSCATSTGQDSRRIELGIVGIVARSEGPRVYVPLDTLARLAEWREGKREALPWEGAVTSQEHYENAVVYVRAPALARFEEACAETRQAFEGLLAELGTPNDELGKTMDGLRKRTLEAEHLAGQGGIYAHQATLIDYAADPVSSADVRSRIEEALAISASVAPRAPAAQPPALPMPLHSSQPPAHQSR